MTNFHDILSPNDQELARSNALSEKIKVEIDKQGGSISFSTFMTIALYDPAHGYYHAKNLTLGKGGDFTTAPEISPLFAQCFAKLCKTILGQLAGGDVLELGAGSGRFAKDFLCAFKEMKCHLNHYYIYEPSQSLRQQQKRLFATCEPQLANRVTWLDHLPVAFKGIIIANEVLDALPVHCFTFDAKEIKERCVSVEDNQFNFIVKMPTTPLLAEAVLNFAKHYDWSSGYSSEINLQLPAFIKNIANCLTKGVILFADYGYGEREYYRKERSQGTLMSFYQHRQFHHPLNYPGLFDITAHVDFTAVVQHAIQYGCELESFTSQASFLLACDLLQFAHAKEETLSPEDAFNMHQAIKLLTMPTEMGEQCKIMFLSKQFDFSQEAFAWHDRRRDL